MGSNTDGSLVIANGTLIDGTGATPRPNGTIITIPTRRISARRYKHWAILD